MVFETFFFSGYSTCKISVKCSYAEAGVKEDYDSTTIDVAADIRTERVITYYLKISDSCSTVFQHNNSLFATQLIAQRLPL